MRVTVVFIALAAIAASGFAQNRPAAPAPPQWEFWLKGQGWQFDNFFQVTDGAPQQDVSAFSTEVGASYQLPRESRAYASAHRIAFDGQGLDHSTGAKLGLRRNGTPHAYDVYFESLRNRPTFEVGDTFGRADVQSLVGEYSYRVTDRWQVAGNGEFSRQSYDTGKDRGNDFRSVGAALRWRPNRLLSPEIGFRTGVRDVENSIESYGEKEAYVAVRSSPVPPLYLSLRFRRRMRDYSTSQVASTNFGRKDDRDQITFVADYSFTPHLAVTLYAAQEGADSNRPNKDFDTAMATLGLTWKF